MLCVRESEISSGSVRRNEYALSIVMFLLNSDCSYHITRKLLRFMSRCMALTLPVSHSFCMKPIYASLEVLIFV